jgi:quercetin dioxygenase-like cupin family protein
MAIGHLASGEVASIVALGSALAHTPTTAIFKDERLEAMRIVLPAGKRMPRHAVDGPITIQCIEGEVDLAVGGVGRTLRAGDLLYLAGGVPHDLTAVADASLLVTIALLPPARPD